MHLTLVPYLQAADGLKTKPTQHSVNKLREIGIQPHILLCRTDRFLPVELKKKIALFCNVDQEAVITAKDVESVYEVPLVFHREGLDEILVRTLRIQAGRPDLTAWEAMFQRLQNPRHHVQIGLVGKYIQLKDAYKSLIEALTHGGLLNETRVHIHWLDADDLKDSDLDRMDGILVPGGFGGRGMEGKIYAIRFARERLIPFLGICLGMQCAVVEFAQNVAGIKNATSSEFDPGASSPVIDLMPDQQGVLDRGGTMRLGAYPCRIRKGSVAHEIYQTEEIRERHRHRFEFNNAYRKSLEKAGMSLSGLSPDGRLVEIVELEDHPWFVGTQFHPEFQSRPRSPHPIFREYIRAALLRSSGQPSA